MGLETVVAPQKMQQLNLPLSTNIKRGDEKNMRIDTIEDILNKLGRELINELEEKIAVKDIKKYTIIETQWKKNGLKAISALREVITSFPNKKPKFLTENELAKFNSLTREELTKLVNKGIELAVIKIDIIPRIYGRMNATTEDMKIAVISSLKQALHIPEDVNTSQYTWIEHLNLDKSNEVDTREREG